MSARIPLCFRPMLMPALTLAAVVALAGAPTRAAQSDGESGSFSALNGTWQGGGAIKKSNGTSERIRCVSTARRHGEPETSPAMRQRQL